MKKTALIFSIFFPLIYFVFNLMFVLPVSFESVHYKPTHEIKYCFIANCIISVIILIINVAFMLYKNKEELNKIKETTLNNLILIAITFFSLALTFFETPFDNDIQSMVTSVIICLVICLTSLISYILSKIIFKEEDMVSKSVYVPCSLLFLFGLTNAIFFSIDSNNNSGLILVSTFLYLISLWFLPSFIIPCIELDREAGYALVKSLEK